MDIADLYTTEAHNAGSEMRVKGKDGKETDFYIMLAGVDSDVWRDDIKQRNRKAVAAAMAGEAVEEVNDAPERLAAATIGWRGLVADKVKVKFTKKRAADMYRNAPYIQDQVNIFIGDRANFTKG